MLLPALNSPARPKAASISRGRIVAGENAGSLSVATASARLLEVNRCVDSSELRHPKPTACGGEIGLRGINCLHGEARLQI